jgi:hypothetical protein
VSHAGRSIVATMVAGHREVWNKWAREKPGAGPRRDLGWLQAGRVLGFLGGERNLEIQGQVPLQGKPVRFIPDRFSCFGRPCGAGRLLA